MIKYIPDSKDYYVGTDGSIHSKHRKLNKNTMHLGYESVAIRYLDGSVRTHYVHRLVATAFLDNPDNLPVVNHKNLNKSDNRVENLEWVTHQENNLHMQENKANRNKDGSAKWAIYTTEQIVRVCEMLADGRRNIEIEKETAVNANDVYMIRSRINWTSISKDYEFRKISRSRKVSEETIRWVCEQILKGRSNSDISKELDNRLTAQDVCKIKTGQLYTDITSQYFKF